MNKILLPILAFVSMSLATTVASAAIYICSVSYEPGSGTLGDKGNIYSSFHTDPDCTGSFVVDGYFCSSGATSSLCSTYSQYRFTDPGQTAAFFATLVRASRENHSVTVSAAGCIGGGSGCLSYMNFLAD